MRVAAAGWGTILAGRFALSVALLTIGGSCGSAKLSEVVIRPAATPPPIVQPLESTARLDPIKRHGGYVLTATGMPRGQYAAYLWAKSIGTLVAYETFLRRYHEGRHAEEFRGLIRERFVPNEEEWKEAWTLYSEIETVDGAIVDPQLGFILLGRKDTGLLSPFFYEDLITALRCSLADAKVGVTMNEIFEAGFRQPPRPERFRAAEYDTSVHFYTPILWGTHLSYVLFEGDRRLKSLSGGYDIFLREEVRSKVPGFKTQVEMEVARQVAGKGADSPSGKYGRVWIELTSVVINTTKQRNVAMFSDVAMEVRAESEHPPPLRFAKHLRENYRAYGKEFPIFAEVERAARIVAISRWLVEVYPEVAQDLVDGAHEQVTVHVPQAIEARNKVTKRTTTTQESLVGGVVFPDVNRYEVEPNHRVGGLPITRVPEAVVGRQPNRDTQAWHVTLGRDDAKRIAWRVGSDGEG